MTSHPPWICPTRWLSSRKATKFVGVHMAAAPAVLFVRRVTSDGQLAGRTVCASKDDPQSLVRRKRRRGCAQAVRAQTCRRETFAAISKRRPGVWPEPASINGNEHDRSSAELSQARIVAWRHHTGGRAPATLCDGPNQPINSSRSTQEGGSRSRLAPRPPRWRRCRRARRRNDTTTPSLVKAAAVTSVPVSPTWRYSTLGGYARDVLDVFEPVEWSSRLQPNRSNAR